MRKQRLCREENSLQPQMGQIESPISEQDAEIINRGGIPKKERRPVAFNSAQVAVKISRVNIVRRNSNPVQCEISNSRYQPDLRIPVEAKKQSVWLTHSYAEGFHASEHHGMPVSPGTLVTWEHKRRTGRS